MLVCHPIVPLMCYMTIHLRITKVVVSTVLSLGQCIRSLKGIPGYEEFGLCPVTGSIASSSGSSPWKRNCLVSFSVPTLVPPITRQLEIDSLAVDDVSTNSTDGFVLGKKACCDSCAHAGPCNATLSNDSDVKLK